MRVRFAFVAAAVSLIIPFSAVLAHGQDWASYDEWAARYSGYNTRTYGDTYNFSSHVMWDSTKRANLQHYVTAHGWRFTLDAHNDNILNATGRYSTNMPSPYYDRDDDEGNYDQWEEAEITAESSSFPTANTWYYGDLYFMRWFDQLQSGWVWMPYSGTMELVEQLSDDNYLAGDKWNTVACCAALADVAFPYQSPPSSAAASSESPSLDGDLMRIADQFSSTRGRPAPRELNAFSLVATQDAGEHRIAPDFRGGVDAYIRKAAGLSRAVIARGNATGIATFARPLGEEQLQSLERAGLVIHSVEAVSAPTSSGDRVTYGAPHTATFWSDMAAVAAEKDVHMLGVVAAEVSVRSLEDYKQLAASPYVSLIDLSLEQVRRSRPELQDVVQNDIYWYQAGWAQP